VTANPVEPELDAVRAVARQADGLRALVLFGSRARHDTWRGSDWDLAYLGDPGFDPDALRARLLDALSTDRIDLVDLDRAGGQLRYRVARDGRVLYARDQDQDAYARFWLDAVSFWCDAEPVIRAGYDRLLAELPR
jgi:predicted nucleotidyltransferase